MTIQLITLDQLHASSHPEKYTLVVVDQSRLPRHTDPVHGVNKIQLLREFRNMTGCGLKIAKGITEALLQDGTVHIKGHFDYGDVAVVKSALGKMGIGFVLFGDEVDMDEDRGDQQTDLLSSIPLMPPRSDTAAEQLHDLILVANRLGMENAVHALIDLQNLVEKLKDCPAAMG